MNMVNDYICDYCGFELSEGNKFFFYDEDSKETVSYRLLMLTVGMDNESKIKGHINNTYCSECGRYVSVYSIREIEGEFENVCDIVKKGIYNNINGYFSEIERLKGIKKRQKFVIENEDDYDLIRFGEYDYLNHNEDFHEITVEKLVEFSLEEFHKEIDDKIDFKSKFYERELNKIIIVLDESGLDDGEISPEIYCSECGSQINRSFDDMICPKCGRLLMPGTRLCDYGIVIWSEKRIIILR